MHQQVCGKAGQLAVDAWRRPDVGSVLLADTEEKSHPVSRAWSAAMRRGLEASPETSERDVYMRGWAACMDVIDPN